MTWTLRPASADDVPALVEIKLAAWPEAYSDFVPKKYLTSLDPEPQLAFWRTAFTDTSIGLEVLLACSGEKPVGVIAYGKAQSASLGASCEIDMIYIRKAHWGKGLGREMMRAAITNMKRGGYTDIGLWTFADNTRARHIYEKMGGKLTGVTKIVDPDGMNLPEVAYHWRSLDDVKFDADK